MDIRHSQIKAVYNMLKTKAENRKKQIKKCSKDEMKFMIIIMSLNVHNDKM